MSTPVLKLSLIVVLSWCFGFKLFSSPINADDETGTFKEKNGDISLHARTSLAGGYKQLFVFRGAEPLTVFNDATGWVSFNKYVICSTSPIYGQSGIFIYDSVNELSSELVKGSEDETFTLISVDPEKKIILYDKAREKKDGAMVKFPRQQVSFSP